MSMEDAAFQQSCFITGQNDQCLHVHCYSDSATMTDHL